MTSTVHPTTIGWHVPRPGRGASAVGWFALGAVAIAVGVGLGIPHLAKTGLSATGLLGGAVLVAGLVVAVRAALAIIGPMRWWARVPVVVALVVVVGVALLTVGQAVGATNVPRTAVGSVTPADHGVAYEDVTFPAADGVRLSGWYVPSRNGAAVAVLHGAGSTRSNVLEEALVLADHGYGVLLYDARGHGDSDGRAMDFGWWGDEDVAGATAFLAARPDVDPDRIGLVGSSMGGEEAIGAAASDARVAAVVAEGATNRVAADKAWLSDVYGFRGAVQEQIERLTYGLADLLTSASPPIALRDAVAVASDTPFLLVAAGEVSEEQDAGRHIRRAAPERVELWTVPGAGHTAGLAVAPEEWTGRVVGFLDRALAAA